MHEAERHDPNRRNRRPGWARARWVRAIAVGAVLFFVVPWAAVQALPVPWAWIFGAWAAALLRLALTPPRRALPFNIAVACLVLAGAEFALQSDPAASAHFRDGTYPGYSQSDDELGYAPVPGVTRTITRYVGDQPIYEVTYTIDDRGRRVGPPGPFRDDAGWVVFFGCSLTYGEGLEDDQTYPYQIGALTDGRFRSVNLAFSGYGPHQALALLETGRAASLVDGAPSHAFFLTMLAHGQRSMGKAHWDMHGPRYRLLENGTVVRDGHFVDDRSPLLARLEKWTGKSNLWKRFRPWEGYTVEEVELTAALLGALRDRIEATWPGCAFHVLVLDRPARLLEQAILAIERRGLEVTRVSEMLPGFGEDPSLYELHATDRHPNAHAARGLATWIAREFLGER